ncbi:hypothetical protein CTAYLR_008138 [Chrysophaeum taylorii]|uniref:Rhodanese domain-containing protein n=1 Tax=Chrysophaeum taylorii TaxID=2483200 RepID=A0AAD7XQ36_9STRA|nr:hypothetical protein CTAYLR_008138 [Chrysophaeum taylorii]
MQKQVVSGDEVESILWNGGGAKEGALARLVELVKAERSQGVEAEAFVRLVERGTQCIDVRSPGEFLRGHVPGATNVPLFDNAERAAVGTCYKHSGRAAAMALGMAKVSKKKEALWEALEAAAATGVACVYCWRGGLRSGAVAWLLRRRGTEVHCLAGGYKGFRRWVRGVVGDCVEASRREDDRIDLALGGDEEKSDEEIDCSRKPDPPVVIVAGRTGVGKTRVLRALRERGRQILDLEGLANHRGSAFGWVSEQPSTEAFENEVAMAWRRLDPTQPVFVEDEETHVGTCSVPKGLYAKMRDAELVGRLVASLDQRVRVLVDDYADEDPAALARRVEATTTRISKRLGGDRTKQALALVEAGDKKNFTRLLLAAYYDKLYDAHLAKRPRAVVDVQVPEADPYDADETARRFLEALNLL